MLSVFSEHTQWNVKSVRRAGILSVFSPLYSQYLGQWFSNLNVHQNRRWLYPSSRVSHSVGLERAWEFACLTSSRWYGCCWSMDQTLRTTSLDSAWHTVSCLYVYYVNTRVCTEGSAIFFGMAVLFSLYRLFIFIGQETSSNSLWQEGPKFCQLKWCISSIGLSANDRNLKCYRPRGASERHPSFSASVTRQSQRGWDSPFICDRELSLWGITQASPVIV